MFADKFIVGQELDAVHPLLQHLSEVFLRVRPVEQPPPGTGHEERGERFEAPLPLHLRRSVERDAVGILEGAVPEYRRPGFRLLVRVRRNDERLREEVNRRNDVVRKMQLESVRLNGQGGKGTFEIDRNRE